MDSLRFNRHLIVLVGIVLALATSPAVVSADMTISGLVTDRSTGEPVVGAWVRTDEGLSSLTDANGTFRLEVPDGTPPIDIAISHIAYVAMTTTVVSAGPGLRIALEPAVLPGQNVVVTADRARFGQTPAAFSNLSRRDLEIAYYAQDVPMVLAETPGTYAYSDGGAGIGYSYLSVRGFRQDRVSVLINGVPHNDPSSHEVYWIDMPDLVNNLEDAQVQRGLGTTVYGATAVGGTVNLQTKTFSAVRRLEFESGVGSYGTEKFSLAGHSGLIDGRYNVYGRFSRIVSDGYREGSWVDMWSYFFSGAYYGDKLTHRVNVYGGPERVHLAYKGIPKAFIVGDTSITFAGQRPTGDENVDRRFNPFTFADETDNFNQPHYEWLTTWVPNDQWTIENTAFYIKGDGFFDQFREGKDYGEYGLTPFEVVVGDDTVEIDETDLVRRRAVFNDFFGIVPRATVKHTNGELTFGGEAQSHRGVHVGRVLWAAQLPPDSVQRVSPDHRYYDYEIRKQALSLFATERYKAADWLRLEATLQWQFRRYELLNERRARLYFDNPDAGLNYRVDYNFISPRVGAIVTPHEGWSLFGHVGFAESEPTSDEVYDPQDYFADPADFFQTFDPATGTGADPVVKTEKIVDVELGVSRQFARGWVELNAYHMTFDDEIVYNGRLNEDGVPLRVNAPSATHRGMELSARAVPADGLTLSGNLSIADNTFDEFSELAADWNFFPPHIDTLDRSGNVIAGFPKHLANLRATYQRKGTSVSAHLRRVGRSYIDNSNDPASSIEPYTTVDVSVRVGLAEWLGMPITAFAHVNNVFDESFLAGGYVDDEDLDGVITDSERLFIVGAKRNAFAGIRIVW